MIREIVQVQDASTPASDALMRPESDEMRAARGGVEDFISLYRTYLGPVYRYVYARVGGNRQEAEDVTALAFEHAWSSLAAYKPIGSFRSWLFTIAGRAVADYYRSGKSAGVQVEALADTLLDPAIGPEESAVLTEQVRGVLRVIAELGEDQRTVITLRYVAGLRYSEIAVVTKKSEAAVKMAAYRALDEIRRRYRDGDF